MFGLLLANGLGWNCVLINSLFEEDEATVIKGIPLPFPKRIILFRARKDQGFILLRVTTNYYSNRLLVYIVGMLFLNRFEMLRVPQKLKLQCGSLLGVSSQPDIAYTLEESLRLPFAQSVILNVNRLIMCCACVIMLIIYRQYWVTQFMWLLPKWSFMIGCYGF